MDYQYKEFIWIGAVAALFWVLDFFRIGRKAQLYLPKAVSAKRSYFRLIFLLIGLFGFYFMTQGMMGPRKAAARVESPIEVNDIYFVVDTSESMNADDFKPSRFEVAKKAIVTFIKMTPVDRMGVIPFSAKAFTLVPLTRDGEVVAKAVSENLTNSFLGSGTNIGDSLALAITRLTTSPAKNKVIILLTDGASNVGMMSPEQAAEEAKEKKVKIYTIGVGSNKNAKIPRLTPSGIVYQQFTGESFDWPLLQSLAQMTGGKSYTASDATTLRRVFDDIGKLERTKVKVTAQIVYEELYFDFFLKGLILFLFAEFGRRLFLKEAAV